MRARRIGPRPFLGWLALGLQPCRCRNVTVRPLWFADPVRLHTLDLDNLEESRQELTGLAELLRVQGFTVEIAAAGETSEARLRESADHTFVAVLHLVLDETERHGIEVAIGAITHWAVSRVNFRGREGAAPTVIVWINGEDVREVPLPDPRRDINRIRKTDLWPVNPWLPLVRHRPDGDREVAMICADDVIADETIRLFGATEQSGQALMMGGVIDGSALPLLGEYDSLERVLAEGWRVDGG
jgi:hypothetical protein